MPLLDDTDCVAEIVDAIDQQRAARPAPCAAP